MHVGIVGGLDRAEPLFHRVAERAGHTVEMHRGRTNARGAAALQALVDRADLIIVVTDLNSHGGVQLARRLAAQQGKPLLLFRRCGASRFAELLDELARREPARGVRLPERAAI
jgi:hypothetical protein